MVVFFMDLWTVSREVGGIYCHGTGPGMIFKCIPGRTRRRTMNPWDLDNLKMEHWGQFKNGNVVHCRVLMVISKNTGTVLSSNINGWITSSPFPFPCELFYIKGILAKRWFVYSAIIHGFVVLWSGPGLGNYWGSRMWQVYPLEVQISWLICIQSVTAPPVSQDDIQLFTCWWYILDLCQWQTCYLPNRNIHNVAMSCRWG